jgi:CRP/FNR family transcriptional regulator, cyclic AMP receptor protein
MNNKAIDPLHQRIQNIWKPADFLSFFQKYAKNPPRKIKKGTVLFNPGDSLSGVYFIVEGFIKLYDIAEDGRETIVYLTGPGNMLSLRAIIAKEHVAHQYTEAITDVILYNMPMADFQAVLAEHPEYFIDMIHVFIDRLNHVERRVEGFIAGDVTHRVATFLYDAAMRFGKVHGKEVELPVAFTHQRIAEFVGSYRETVTLALSKLQKEGLIKVNRGKIVILNIDKLAKRVSSVM